MADSRSETSLHEPTQIQFRRFCKKVLGTVCSMHLSLFCNLVSRSAQVFIQITLLPTLKAGRDGGELSCQESKLHVPSQGGLKTMDSHFFLPSMDSIFDLIFESASAQSSSQCADCASKEKTTVQMTSVID